MKIAIASGKGGTGKTTVATNLAFVATQTGKRVHLLDCDVEEPNCHIFVKPVITKSEPVYVPVPKVDEALCTGCGQCSAVCQFKAIACLGKKALAFPEMCHGCGACWLICPERAISQSKRQVGILEDGSANGFRFTHGRLRVGEAMSPPLIRKLKASVNGSSLCIIDAPPGTSCPVVSAIKNCDFVCLVTEPTPFGLNDLALAVSVVRKLKMPAGVVVNRADIGDKCVMDYCRVERLPVLVEIPDDRRIAEAYSRGQLICEAIPQMRPVFEHLLVSIEAQMQK